MTPLGTPFLAKFKTLGSHVCASGAHECHSLAKCVPNPDRKRGYDCECMSGYVGNGNAQFIVSDPSIIDQNDLAFGPNGPKGCVDVDECSAGSHNCVAQTPVENLGPRELNINLCAKYYLAFQKRFFSDTLATEFC